MNRTKSKFHLFVLLVLVLAIWGQGIVRVHADEEAINLDADEAASMFIYAEIEGAVSIIKYIGREDVVYIPDSIEGIPVKHLCDSSFGHSAVKKVVVPASVNKLDGNVFDVCPALVDLTLVSNELPKLGSLALDSRQLQVENGYFKIYVSEELYESIEPLREKVAEMGGDPHMAMSMDENDDISMWMFYLDHMVIIDEDTIG